MKSYKDIDKEIILNAPEGAMWVSDSDGYYKYNSGKMFLYDSKQRWDSCFDHNLTDWRVSEHNLIPLPNIEIPWEATADSVCPVPKGTKTCMKFKNDKSHTDSSPRMWTWGDTCNTIIAYKIIDEDYMKPGHKELEQTEWNNFLDSTVDKVVEFPELEMHRAAYQAIKNAGFESPEELLAEYRALREEDDSEVVTTEVKLFRKLRFLQNLANEFPGIRNEAIKFMECELDGYMNTLWEKDNDE